MFEDIERSGQSTRSAAETESRLDDLTEAATDVLVAVWKAIQRGKIDERGPVADATLRMRDILNPDWPANPDWLPDELLNKDAEDGS